MLWFVIFVALLAWCVWVDPLHIHKDD